MLEPKEGLLTFRAEGDNYPGSRYYSRKIHWPGNSAGCARDASGVTIGRGFDLGSRTKEETLQYLAKAGLSSEHAKKIAEGSRLKYCQARRFVKENQDSIGEITESQQLQLFNVTYIEYVRDAKRFYNAYKGDGSLPWSRLDHKIKEIFVDMKYQGALRIEMVRFFEKNEKEEVIKLILSNARLKRDEDNRQRISYLKGR
ncbi:pesticin C-terminus-like muramidase [Erwinia sp. BNK-24-b]|uniref:pesticin C-terminus-like muramidase n=1 Tax=unclassified Erwinia TaxID=2622719 RepID=UPI0039BF8E22